MCTYIYIYIYIYLYADIGKLLSKSNFRWFGPLNWSEYALKVIRCCSPLGL